MDVGHAAPACGGLPVLLMVSTHLAVGKKTAQGHHDSDNSSDSLISSWLSPVIVTCPHRLEFPSLGLRPCTRGGHQCTTSAPPVQHEGCFRLVLLPDTLPQHHHGTPLPCAMDSTDFLSRCHPTARHGGEVPGDHRGFQAIAAVRVRSGRFHPGHLPPACPRPLLLS